MRNVVKYFFLALMFPVPVIPLLVWYGLKGTGSLMVRMVRAYIKCGHSIGLKLKRDLADTNRASKEDNKEPNDDTDLCYTFWPNDPRTLGR